MTPLNTWQWALRAFRKEVLDFRVDYPIEEVALAGPSDSLHYYVYSERLFFDAMELDAKGIPIHRSRTFETYNPAYVAWYGLMRLERSLRNGEDAGREAFLRQVQWLRDHAVRRDDDSVIWPLTFDWVEGKCRLRAPWVSAMIQGLAISALIRAHRALGDDQLLDLCRAALGIFEKSVQDGGVVTIDNGHAVYEEYPGFPLPRVLDGFLFSLLGLYDLVTETQDAKARQLLTDGLDGLRHLLPFWDYRGKWSWYGSHGYLCPPQYNRLNSALLGSLARLSSDPCLQRYAVAWRADRLRWWSRAEIFMSFVATKNWSRLRHLRQSGYIGMSGTKGR
jgi:heparosan-N-sulfate-glucuronate 5-epimerase